MMNWSNPKLPYELSRKDILSLNILFNATYAMNIKVIGEKELPNSHKLFMITAPAIDNSNYTGTGFTIAEAIRSWFSRVEEIKHTDNDIKRE